VRVDREPTYAGLPELQTVRVRVEEAPPLSLTLGAGYDNEGGPRGRFSLGHVNIDGTGLETAFQGKYSATQNRLEFLTRKQRFGSTRLGGLANVFYESTEQTGYDEQRRSAAARLDLNPRPRWKHFFRYSLQDVRLSNVENPDDLIREKTQDIRLGDISYSFLHNTQDDVFAAQKGYYFGLEGSWFDKYWFSEESFLRVYFQSSVVHTRRNRQSFAAAFRIGVAQPLRDTEYVPLSERFFAGGDSTVRGYARDTLGPSLNGVPIGGEAFVVLNGEWRIPVWKDLFGVVFLDMGNVYMTLPEFDPLYLKVTTGLGLRFMTPIGPIRVEYGRKLNREPSDSLGELFIAIGPAF
jgi:outer membrane translocation and assembly module TamA